MHPRSRASELSLRGDEEAPRKGGDNLFVWTIIILLLIGLAIGCWIFSFYVFGHPEKSFSYSILTKLKKLDDPKRFELTAAPQGEFFSAQGLWDKYNTMTDRELQRASEAMLRNYLRNYKLSKDKVPYITGTYNILDSYELTDKNLFSSGVVALAQSKDIPYVLLEHIFTADKRDIPILHRMLLTGLDLPFDRKVDLSTLINVKRLPDGRLLFTAIPLLYGSYTASVGPGSFSLQPPTKLNVAAGLPILNNDGVTEADQKLSSYRLRAGLNTTAGATPPPRPQLMRVERPEAVDETVAVATPTPAPAETPARPAATPSRPVAVATPSPTPEVPLQPFASPTPAAIANTAGGKWPVYPPGQMPRGRLLNVPDVSDLAGRGVGGERIYLQGNFVVTAVGQNRAVLRAQGAGDNLGIGGGNSANTRIIVEYPATGQAPSEGATFSRDSRRPFLITEIRRASDGQVNVYAREITGAQ